MCIAEPVSRPNFIHEWQLSKQSLYASVSVGLDTDTIIKTLSCFSKVKLPPLLITKLKEETRTYGKVKIVLKDTRYYVESPLTDVLSKLLLNPDIAKARVLGTDGSLDFIESDKMVLNCVFKSYLV